MEDENLHSLLRKQQLDSEASKILFKSYLSKIAMDVISQDFSEDNDSSENEEAQLPQKVQVPLSEAPDQ